MSSLSRRNFLGGVSLGTFGLLGAGPRRAAASPARCGASLRLSAGPRGAAAKETMLNVKPVGCYMIHAGVWTGPCRWNPNRPPEEEQVIFRDSFTEFAESLKKELGPEARLLDPVYQEYPEAGGFGEQQLAALIADHEEVDLYLIQGNTYPQWPGALIGERYLKPVAMLGGYVNWDLSARLRSKALEGYAPADMAELNELIAVLRARKAFQSTRIMIVSDTPFANRPAPSACMDLEGLNRRFGIEAELVGYQEFGEERERIENAIPEMNRINQEADRLLAAAESVRIERQWMIPSLVYLEAIRSLMQRHQCNAFTTECFEFCSRKLACEWKVVPCLAHSLLKDQGCPSGCEGDMNALLAMDLLMGVARRSAFMGNLWKRDQGSMTISHNVPGLKMLGFDQPDLPYSLQNFIAEGWGPKVQMDMARFDEKTVTIARISPTAERLLLIRGTILACEGQDQPGCSMQVAVKVDDPDGLVRKARNYGFHYALVYGDWTGRVSELAAMLGIEVDSHLS